VLQTADWSSPSSKHGISSSCSYIVLCVLVQMRPTGLGICNKVTAFFLSSQTFLAFFLILFVFHFEALKYSLK